MEENTKSKRIVLILTLGVAYLLVASLVLAGAIDRQNGGVPFTTFDRDYASYIGYDDFDYHGEYLVIRNQSSWADFWFNHTSGYSPQPPVPTNISWGSEMVLVAIQGFVSDCCASYIRFVHIESEGGTLYAHVERVFRDGPMPTVTNPFHIIVLESAPTVVFVEGHEPQEPRDLLELASLVVLLFILAAMVLLALRWRPRTESLR